MMGRALKIIVAGAMGRMGQALVRFIDQAEDCELFGAVERPDHADLGADIGSLLLGRRIDVALENDLWHCLPGAQAIIDFSQPEPTLLSARIAAENKIPLVIGTTGFSAEQKDEIRRAAQKAPMVLAPNMSVGVNLLFHLAGRAASILDEDYDVEIVETHHRHKVDAPSGTALRLAEIVAHERGVVDPETVFEHGRQGAVGPRGRGKIGIHALRGGEIIGRHDLGFYSTGEVLTLSHHATSRDNFVQGAIRAAHWLQKQAPGLYDMLDVLGLK